MLSSKYKQAQDKQLQVLVFYEPKYSTIYILN